MADAIGPEYVTTIRDALAYLHGETSRLIQGYGAQYADGSLADKEHGSYANPDAVFNACAIAQQLVELGSEHLSVLSKILVEPIEPIASFTCIRSMLESCAIAAWLMDPRIDAHARASRVFAIRFEGLQQGVKLARACGQPGSEIDAQKAQIDRVEAQAAKLGFKLLRNSKTKERTGIGERMPGPTEIIKAVIDEEFMYRLLSAVAHGHTWAILQLCYIESTGDDAMVGATQAKAFKKHIKVDMLALANRCGIGAFLRALWNQCRFYGWDQLKFEEVFEDVADRLQIANSKRFWRSYPAAGDE